MVMSRSAAGYGSGLISTASTRRNMAELAAMAMASVAMATAVKLGERQRARAAVRMTVLIVKADPREAIDRFRHFYRRTNDPADRCSAALAYLAAGYYQRPAEFSDEMSALFGPGADVAERLCADGRCELRFAQYEQRYALPCRVRALDESEAAFQARSEEHTSELQAH